MPFCRRNALHFKPGMFPAFLFFSTDNYSKIILETGDFFRKPLALVAYLCYNVIATHTNMDYTLYCIICPERVHITSVKMHSPVSCTLYGAEIVCVAASGTAFFVRSFGCALFVFARLK